MRCQQPPSTAGHPLRAVSHAAFGVPRDIPDFSNRREVGVDPQRVCIDEHFAEVANKRQGIAAAIATRMTGLDVYARPSR